MQRRFLVGGAVVIALTLSLAVAGVVVVRQQQQEAELARRRAIAAAIARAGQEVRPAFKAHDAVQLHFVNMDFYVNQLTPAEEAAPLLAGLAQGHASVATARKTVQSAPTTESVELYLQGLDELDEAISAFERYVPEAASLGDKYQRVSTKISAQRDIGSTGYARSDEPMRAAMKSNPDRTRGVEMMTLAKQHLDEAALLARALEPRPE